MATKKAPVKKTARDILAAELRSMMKDLDEEGLAFLVEQARVHLHNMNVIRLEEELAAASRSDKKGAAKKSASRIPAADFRIDRSPSGRPTTSSAAASGRCLRMKKCSRW